MRNFRTIRPFLKKYWPHYLFGIIVLILIDYVELLMPQLYREFADLAASGSLNMENLRRIVLTLLAYGFTIGIGRFIWRNALFGTSRQLEYWLRDKLFRKYLSLDASFYNVNRTGDLMASATHDVNNVRQAMGEGVMLLIDSLFMTAMTVAMMVRMVGWRSTAVAMVSLPILCLSVFFFIPRFRQRTLDQQNAYSHMTSEVQENLDGIRVIKGYGIEPGRSDSFKEANDNYRDKTIRMIWMNDMIDPAVSLIAGISIITFMVYGSRQVIQGNMTVGQFLAVIEYIFMIVWPLVAFGLVAARFQLGSSSMERINELLAVQPKVKECDHPIVLEDPKGEIVFSHVWFRYHSDTAWILKDVSFTVGPGKSVGILGRTGQGKSTLIDLLLRRYDVTRGEITMDGVDIRHLSFESLYRGLAVVPQDNFLFKRTIEENIAFSADEADPDKAVEAAEFSEVMGDIRQMPDGMKTMVGERGVTLSGGQQQRVAIARAYYKNAPLLVMDDSLSAVDTETENRILTNLKSLHRGILVVSQRVSTIQHADEILVIGEGEIQQRGKHEELLLQEGFYKDLYHRQLIQNQWEEKQPEKQRKEAGHEA